VHQGHKFRERSPKALVDEIERGYREFGIDFFYLWGDTVTLNVKSFSAFCEELIARNLPVQWFGNARADNLTDPAFVHRLRRAGCWMLAMGIETESEDIRKDMVKKLERVKIQTALNNMRDAGIRSFAFFILGYPGETLATIEQTIEYAVELNPDFANFYPAVPYPGTALYDKVVRDGMLVDEDWSRMEYSYYLLRGGGLDERIVMESINRAKRRFFLRPAYMLRHAGDGFPAGRQGTVVPGCTWPGRNEDCTTGSNSWFIRSKETTGDIHAIAHSHRRDPGSWRMGFGGSTGRSGWRPNCDQTQRGAHLDG